MKNITIKDTAKFVKNARKKLGLSQKKLSEAINKEPYCVSDYEKQRSIPPGNVVLIIQDMLKKLPNQD